MNSKDRLLQFIEYKKISKNKFYLSTGIGNNYLGNVKSLGSEIIERIISIFPDLNVEWLISGKGSMIKTAYKETPEIVNEPQAAYGACKNCEMLKRVVDNQIDYIENLKKELEECKEKLELVKKKAS